MATSISPKTTGALDITLLDKDGAAITSGTFTASVYNPRGTQVATGQSLSHIGAGVWRMTIVDTWSAVAGKALEGEYVVELAGSYSGSILTERVRYPVFYSDNS